MLWADENGKTLVIALIVMGVATLLIGGFLYYVSTSQRLTTAVEEELRDHYAADAGVEHAIWRLENEPGFTQSVTASGSVVYSITINNETVTITVTQEQP
ncbi:MAG: hypothetical protein ACP5HM_08075 [Anaerolineae bacterium]